MFPLIPLTKSFAGIFDVLVLCALRSNARDYKPVSAVREIHPVAGPEVDAGFAQTDFLRFLAVQLLVIVASRNVVLRVGHAAHEHD